MIRRRVAQSMVVAIIASLFAAAGPAMAADTAAHAAEQIVAIRDQGLADMDAVVAGFGAAISLVGTSAEVDAIQAAAVVEIETIWADAKKAIEDLVKLYPGPLGGIANSAKKDLQKRRNSARIEIDDMADAWAPPAPITTTTSTTTPGSSTTTTTPEPTTTTTTSVTTTSGGGGQGTTPPGNGNGGGNGAGNGNGNGTGGGGGSTGVGSGSADVTPPTVPSPSVDDAGSAQTGSIGGPMIDQVAMAVPVLTPTQVSSAAAGASIDPPKAGPAAATNTMSAVLDTVLPPAVVDLVLSPLLVLEILIRTTLDDGRRVLAPLILLAASAIMVALADRAIRRHSTL
jgi:hypothetical protein